MDNLAGATSSKKMIFPLPAAIGDQRLLGLEWDLVPTSSLHAQLPQAPGNGSLSHSAAATARFSKVSLVAAQTQVLLFLGFTSWGCSGSHSLGSLCTQDSGVCLLSPTSSLAHSRSSQATTCDLLDPFLSMHSHLLDSLSISTFWGWLSHNPFYSLPVWQNTWEEQLNGGKAFSGSQFEEAQPVMVGKIWR